MRRLRQAAAWVQYGIHAPGSGTGSIVDYAGGFEIVDSLVNFKLRVGVSLWATLLLCFGGGCQLSQPMFEPHGKTFYLDGAGGWGFGRTEVPEGLRRAGYLGDCEVFDWSPTRIPLIDQVDPFGINKLQAQALAKRIRQYKQRWPGREVNIVALSAGTGVATWALEHLAGRYQVDNVFFVGSSLASNYDMRRALRSVQGQVYVYYSPHDLLLQFVKTIGTVDGQLYAQVAGRAGLRGEGSESGKIVNIGWDEKWARLGWKGGHTDCVGRSFVQYEIARKLMNKERSVPTTRERLAAEVRPRGSTGSEAAAEGGG